MKERIMRAKGDYGLLFFYSPTCEYCEEQEKIMRFFEDRVRLGDQADRLHPGTGPRGHVRRHHRPDHPSRLPE